MISRSLLKLFIQPRNLVIALKHPLFALRELKTGLIDISYICSLVGIRREEFNHYIEEVRSNKHFSNHVLRKLKRFESRLVKERLHPGTIGEVQGAILYTITRALKPEVVLETGVASGLSSTCILLALEENRKGKLHSIDLSLEERGKSHAWASPLPKGEQPGWLVPEELRHRWVLALGKSSEVMPAILEQLKSIDIFLHDSDHSYENMKWEYNTAWPYLKRGGVLLSHDIDANDAFPEFCRCVEGESFLYKGGFGGIVKS